MNGTERREQILSILKNSEKPVPGVELAQNPSCEPSGNCAGYGASACQWSGNPLYEPRIVTAEEHSCSRVFKVNPYGEAG